MSALKLALPVTVAMAGFLFCTSITYGTPEFAKKEKKTCNTCHTKVSSDKAEMAKALTPTGTCYRDNDHSLAKCTK